MTTSITLPDPGRLISFVISTQLAISATTEATAQVVATAATFTANGVDSYWVEFFAPAFQTGVAAGATMSLVLYDNGSAISAGVSTIAKLTNPNAASFVTPVYAARKVTPAAGSHAYSVRAFRAVVNGAIYSNATTQPGFICVRRAP